MNKRIEYTASWTNWVAFCAFFLSFLALNAVASFATAEEFDVSQWQESSERKAGTRMTMKIGNDEYGFVWIPAGEFVMGSPKSEGAWANQSRLRFNEDQIHVKLTRGFWMLETEVPQLLYREVAGTNPSYFQGSRLPVEHVSYEAAAEFCEKLTQRLPKGLTASLPTEAEWEYACRAGTTTAYNYGDKPDAAKMHARIGGTPDGIRRSTPGKTYAPNAWGLYDMHGNVSEWVRDWYVESYLGEYGPGTVVDPEGPESGSEHVNRGGGWDDGWNRSAARRAQRSRASEYNGFRFVLRYE